MDPRYEGKMLRETLQLLPRHWDGPEKVIEMRDGGCPNWRQTEWFGFYFEWKGKESLIRTHGGGDGPRYGRSAIDYRREYPWDLKAHCIGTRSGFTSLNDLEAVDRAIAEFGGVGFLVATGIPARDEARSFRERHVRVSGGESAYSKRNRAEGAPSRMRKRAFELQDVDGFFLEGQAEVARALGEGWLTNRNQVGMKNSNKAIRRAKYGAVVERIPSWARV